MLVHERPPRYGAYLLRYWEVRSDRPGQPSTWRFSLEEAGTGERRGFRDLEALLAYLEREVVGAIGARENEKEYPSGEAPKIADSIDPSPI